VLWLLVPLLDSGRDCRRGRAFTVLGWVVAVYVAGATAFVYLRRGP